MLFRSFFSINLARQNRHEQELFQQTYKWLDKQEAKFSIEKTFGEKPYTEKSKGAGIEEFIELIQSSRDEFLSGGKLSIKLKSFIDNIDYWSYLVSEHSKDEKKARWKYANIEYLIRMIEEWENDPDTIDPGLYAYLNRISLLSRTDGDDDNADSKSDGKGKVNLMTIHASKGLEFPLVFIAGAEAGIIPHERSLEDEDSSPALKPMEEERRLFYVAITRAREKVFITGCKIRRLKQNDSERSPSPFLAEIPSHLIEYPRAEDKTADTGSFFSLLRERYGSAPESIVN